MNKKKLTIASCEKLIRMLEGQSVPSSALPAWLSKELKEEELLIAVSHGSRVSYHLSNVDSCRHYLKNRYTSGREPEEWLATLLLPEEQITRQLLVEKTNDSKQRKHRTFKGFLVNCYEPIEASLNDEPFLLSPCKGLSLFIHDPEHFRIPADVTIVGIENGENFNHIREQRYLFGQQKILFVSRYPQSTDLRQWLMSIPNSYLHFGDFDLAGIRIYLSEFHRYLGARSTFFIPLDIDQRLQTGNADLYDKQYAKYKNLKAEDESLQALIDLIHRYRRTYEQEGYLS